MSKDKKKNQKELSLYGEVDSHIVSKVITFFNNNSPIDNIYYVYLCTEGGEVDCGFAIYDIFNFIRSKGEQIETICVGRCYSIGTLILCSGSTVKSLPNTQFLVHYGFEVNTTQDEKKQSEAMHKKYVNILDSNLTVGRRTINSWMSKEKYFMPDQALKAGLIGEIIGK